MFLAKGVMSNVSLWLNTLRLGILLELRHHCEVSVFNVCCKKALVCPPDRTLSEFLLELTSRTMASHFKEIL